MKMPRRRRRPISLPTASMGDIAFLLTIFFMVCSNFAKETGLKLVPPRAPEVQRVKESRISVAIDAAGQLRLQGRRMANVDAVEEGITALLRGRTEESARMVMFKCDKNVDKAVFEPVLEAISRAGGIIVAVGEKSQ